MFQADDVLLALCFIASGSLSKTKSLTIGSKTSANTNSMSGGGVVAVSTLFAELCDRAVEAVLLASLQIPEERMLLLIAKYHSYNRIAQ